MDESIDLSDSIYGLQHLMPASVGNDKLDSQLALSLGQFDSLLPPANYTPHDTIHPGVLDLPLSPHDENRMIKYDPSHSSQRSYSRGTLPSNLRSRSANASFSIPGHVPGQRAYNPTPTYDYTYRIDMDPRHLSNGGFRMSHDITHQPHLPYNFGTDDLTFPNRPPADDSVSINCSQVSCSSQCCSTQPCQDEGCSGDGTPCDDMDCFQNLDLDQQLDSSFNFSWEQPVPSDFHSSLHNQPCNHTNTEHDVAMALRNLGGDSTSNQPQQVAFPTECAMAPDFGCSLPRNHSLPEALDPHAGIGYITESSSQLSLQVDSSQKHKSPITCNWVTETEYPDGPSQPCLMVFNNAKELHTHMCQNHIDQMTSKTKYVCRWDGCTRNQDQTFASKNKLRRHVACHTAYKPFECHVCKLGFSAKQALDQHMRIHTGEKPFFCDFPGCEKTFKQKSALTMHRRTHTGEKPLHCEICGKSFCESSNLSKHRKIHTSNFKYPCEHEGCDSRFIRLDQLRRHKLRHQKSPVNKKDSERHDHKLRVRHAISSSTPESPQYPMTPMTPMDDDIVE
ncbi:hypothetical protein F5Y15DRAFT_364929 [Xylariaceae sp. FL0016]|nr:hypothetical protein F5Y15DRAFT_364929 [Xylariaceae sp. FL0016]